MTGYWFSRNPNESITPAMTLLFLNTSQDEKHKKINISQSHPGQ